MEKTKLSREQRENVLEKIREKLYLVETKKSELDELVESIASPDTERYDKSFITRIMNIFELIPGSYNLLEKNLKYSGLEISIPKNFKKIGTTLLPGRKYVLDFYEHTSCYYFENYILRKDVLLFLKEKGCLDINLKELKFLFGELYQEDKIPHRGSEIHFPKRDSVYVFDTGMVDFHLYEIEESILRQKYETRKEQEKKIRALSVSDCRDFVLCITEKKD